MVLCYDSPEKQMQKGTMEENYLTHFICRLGSYNSIVLLVAVLDNVSPCSPAWSQITASAFDVVRL